MRSILQPCWLIAVFVFVFGMGLAGGWSLRGTGFGSWILRLVGLEQSHLASPRKAPEVTNSFVILALGQSNAANHGRPRGRAGAGTYAFAADGFFACEDPLPGASGSGGSV